MLKKTNRIRYNSAKTKDFRSKLISSIRQNKMAQSIAKQVNEMLELAKKVGSEVKFQQKPQYKKFKAKHSGKKVHNELKYLANGLISLKFYEECIYWSHKFIEDLRISDKEDRHKVIIILTFSYYNLKNYEKTLEYGQKSLDLQLEQPESQTIDILVAMRASASKIKRYQDASKFAKEILKINIVKYNKKEIATYALLESYSNLIDLQIKDENIIGARKTMKHLKILNLNSTDSNDVLVSLEKEGLKELELLNDQLGNVSLHLAEEEKRQHLSNFRNKNFANKDDLKKFMFNLQMYHYAGKICWMKFLIYRRCDSKQNCENWGLLHMNMLPTILYHMNIIVNHQDSYDNFEDLKEEGFMPLPYEHYILELINCSLRLANDDPLDLHDRELIFGHLCQTLLTSRGNPGNYIAETIRKYPINVMEEVMPFIQFFIKCSPEDFIFSSFRANDQAAHYQEQKRQMISLKNSLIIMNHFKTDKET